LLTTVIERPRVIERQIDQPWHVLWTHSHCEQLVHDQLAAKGFDLLLPKIDVWSRVGGVRRLLRVPMFPGYLFVRHAMDKPSYLEVCKARGLVRVLGERWDRLEAVQDGEIAAIQRVLDAGFRVRPHPYLRVGQRVRITRGPLVDVEGILLRAKPNKGLLVLSVDLLQKAIAVEVDCTLVTAA
jgi:transcription termination/antitermination protein NusG